MAKILVVDDEKLIVKGIRFSLMQDGYEVDTAYDGEEALDKARNSAYDVVLLDVMLPKLNGFEVCQQIREFSDMPIIMLTAKGEDMDKILGLDYGADDYITKPFNILEVKARIKAIMRRTAAMKRAQAQTAKPRENVLTSGDLKLNKAEKIAYKNGEKIDMTNKEFELLQLLVENPNKTLTKEYLFNKIWGSDSFSEQQTLTVHIKWLREKIEENPKKPVRIQTVWGVGYKFV